MSPNKCDHSAAQQGWLPSSLASALLPLAIVLIFFWVPDDADQGFSQRIFYLHVPVALTAYACFAAGAFFAVRYLLRRDETDDLRSYVGVHLGIIFGTLVLITGPIWARISWGVWWDWGDRQLNVFLILFLYYAAYFMLRFSLEPGRAAPPTPSAYTLLGVGLIPLSIAAVHLAESLIHPTVITQRRAADGGLDAAHVPRSRWRASWRSAPRCSRSSCRASSRPPGCAACS